VAESEASSPQSSFGYGVTIDFVNQQVGLIDESAAFFQRMNLHDSVITFFPYGECQFNDTAGVISEGTLYNEALELNISLHQNNIPSGKPLNEIKGDYVWSKFSVPGIPFTGGKVAGVSLFSYVSNYRFLDQIGSSSYNGTVDSVARQIAQNVYGITATDKLKISPGGTMPDYWYRTNELNASFIRKDLVVHAFNRASANSKSPFVSFINLKNEFYFMSLEDLFAQQVSATLIPYQAAEQGMDGTVMVSYSPMYLGYDNNSNSYSHRQFSFTDSYSNIDYQLTDSLSRPLGKGKYLIDKNILSSDPYNILNWGLQSDKDSDAMKGAANYLFVDACLSYRMDEQTSFNADLVAGHLVELEMKSVLSAGLSPEYSGKYVILESHHALGPKGQAFTNCMLAKSTVDVRSDHTFFGKFL
jgi:hypothetical protein